jgi:hypothetical protein
LKPTAVVVKQNTKLKRQTQGAWERHNLISAVKRFKVLTDLIVCGKSFHFFDATTMNEWAKALV